MYLVPIIFLLFWHLHSPAYFMNYQFFLEGPSFSYMRFSLTCSRFLNIAEFKFRFSKVNFEKYKIFKIFYLCMFCATILKFILRQQFSVFGYVTNVFPVKLSNLKRKISTNQNNILTFICTVKKEEPRGLCFSPQKHKLLEDIA